jgi:hypothetical protein
MTHAVGNLKVTNKPQHMGEKFKEFLKKLLLRIFELKRIYNGFFGFLAFLAHFGP